MTEKKDGRKSNKVRRDGSSNVAPRKFDGVPWSRQPEESTQAYDAFKLYRDLGPRRSIAKVAEKLGKSLQLITRWSSRDSWVLRCELYEQEQEADYQAELKIARREAARRHAMQGQSVAALAMAVLEKKFGKDLRKLTAKSLQSGELLRYLVEGVKIERTALGEPTEISREEGTAPTVVVTQNNDNAPTIPLTYAGRIDEALALIETARARAADEASRPAD